MSTTVGLDAVATGPLQLVDRAKAEGVKLTGPGGLLGDLTKRVLEAGLEGDHRGEIVDWQSSPLDA